AEAAAPLLADVRLNATRLADRRVTAALHVLVGEMEAKRGLLQSAERHTKLGIQILGPQRQLWLESLAANTRVALSIMRGELDRGFQHAEYALTLARECGAATMLRAS